MEQPRIKLSDVQERAAAKARLETPKQFGVADFINKKEYDEFRERKLKRARKKRRFDDADALIAEIISRFGWDTYQRWNAGEIDNEWITRLIYAERAREAAQRLELEAVVFNSLLGTRFGVKRPRQQLEQVQKILEDVQKMVRGEY